jgi:hypothetical protein
MYENKLTYDIISEQRNSLLHGQRPWEKLYASLVNIIFIMLNSFISIEEYEFARQSVLQNIQRGDSGFGGLSFYYYPPI